MVENIDTLKIRVAKLESALLALIRAEDGLMATKGKEPGSPECVLANKVMDQCRWRAEDLVMRPNSTRSAEPVAS